MARASKAFFLVAALVLALAAPAAADPYPPRWPNYHYAPVAWPADGAWIAVSTKGTGLMDKRDGDQTKGPGQPQGLTNVSSGCTDETLPSIYWQFDNVNKVLFFRWRVEQTAVAYCTSGNAPPDYSSTDPFKSGLWTVFIETDGDGWREFAMHLDGSSGGPGTDIDILRGLWADDNSQEIDPAVDANVHITGHNPAAFVAASPSDKILNFHNAYPSSAPDTTWGQCKNVTVWDYGTSRETAITSTDCTEFFIDYQIPYAMMDARTWGGPLMTGDEPICLMFTTGNSLNDAFQKDFVYSGAYTSGANVCLPGSDYIIPSQGTTILQPIITAVSASGCAPTSLSADGLDAITNNNGACALTIVSLDFYYYHDANGNGSPDDGGTWTYAVGGTPGTWPQWTASWDTSTMMNGQYIITARAEDSEGHVTWSALTQAQVNAQIGATPPNYANPSPNPGQTYATLTIDCGVASSVSGYVYNDADRGQARETGEAGTGSTAYVKLCQSGALKYVAAADPTTGYYSIPGPALGTYDAIEGTNNSDCTAADPSGWVSTTPNTLSINVTGILSNVNFGDYHGARIQGTVFEDKGSGAAGSLLANNAVYDSPTEAGIREATVRACQDSACASVISQTATNGAGQYEFWLPSTYNGQTIYILETDPGTYHSTGNSIGAVAQNTTAQPEAARNQLSLSMASGTEYSDYNFGDVLPLGITPPQSYIVGQGSTLSIAHAINIQTPGAAAVSLASQEAWEYVVYEDADCDGQPDGDPLVPSGGYYALNGGTGLGNGTSCLVLRLMVPSSIPAGTVEKLSVIANENWSNTSGTNADTGTIHDDLSTVLDTITVAAGATGEIRLEKYVRNVTLGQGFSFSNTASPCDVLEYRVDFKNIGARNQSSLVLGDNIPMGTELLLNQYNGSTSDVRVSVMGSTYYGTVDDSPDSDGATLANDTLVVDLKKLSLNAYATLTPGQSGSLLYQVRLKDSCP